MVLCLFTISLTLKDLISSGFKAKSIASGDMDFEAGKLDIQIPRLELK